MRRLGQLVFLLPAVLGALSASAELPAPWFVDTAREAGLVHPTWCGREAKPHILESGGTGLALFDYDHDGDLDLYLVNGWRLEGAEVAEHGRNLLYRNRGDGIFEEVGTGAGVDDDGWGTGIAVGDVDGDGWDDLFVSNFGPDVLYRNRGDGTFEVVAEAPSIDGWSTGAALFDADGDGDQDLFLAAYIDCTLEEVLHARPDLDWEGHKVMFGPFGLEGKANRYYRNLGGGRFEEATVESGLGDSGLYYSFGVTAVDLDGDLDLDLYVANDSNPNYLYRNDKGVFQEVGLWSGAALDEMGNAQAGMGVNAADVNGDGLVDLFVTNFYKDVSTLYLNLGDFVFEDATKSTGLREATYSPLSWGTLLADLDLDSDLDLFIANGHIYPQADDAPSAGTSYRQRNTLLLGQGERFVDAGTAAGPGLAVEESSRGLAAGDLDGDGDLDLVVANMDAPPTLLRNDTSAAGAWLLVDAAAAMTATVETAAGRLTRHRILGGSYVSASDTRFHFGLGEADRVRRLEIRGSDGRRVVFEDLPADRVVIVSGGRAP